MHRNSATASTQQMHMQSIDPGHAIAIELHYAYTTVGKDDKGTAYIADVQGCSTLGQGVIAPKPRPCPQM